MVLLRTLASLGGLLVALVGPGASFAGPRIYCCHDDSGKQVCGDILPSVCYGRAYRELGDSGRTSRLVDAPLTVEQRAQRAAEEQRRKEQERVLNEQRRMDQALLNTYASEKDIEIMRSRAERDLTAAIKAAEERIAEIRKQRKKFEDEAEFYRNRQLPAEVAKGLRDADYEIGAQESVIESKKRDQETMRAKYDEDLRRFRELSKRPLARP
jgi:hypothetical protein